MKKILSLVLFSSLLVSGSAFAKVAETIATPEKAFIWYDKAGVLHDTTKGDSTPIPVEMYGCGNPKVTPCCTLCGVYKNNGTYQGLRN